MWRQERQQSANAIGSTASGPTVRARTILSFRRLPYAAFMSRKERGCAKSIAVFTSKRRFAFWIGSLFVYVSDRTGIEAVISADDLELTGVNFGFENRHL